MSTFTGRHRRLLLLALIATLLFSSACGAPSTESEARPSPAAATATDSQPSQVPPTQTSLATQTASPSETLQPTHTSAPTVASTPSPTPGPAYRQPVVLAEIRGTGAVVTDNYEFPECQKAVFHWTAHPNDYGTVSLRVNLHNVTTERDMSIVEQFAMDVSSAGLTGSDLQALSGGAYYFTTETDQAWEVRVECQDGMAPIAVGTMNIQGEGHAVTDNYELPSCSKSVFTWEVSPNEYGTVTMYAILAKVGTGLEVWPLVHEFAMDREEPLVGEVLQKLSGGHYYCVVRTDGPWSIEWECRDS